MSYREARWRQYCPNGGPLLCSGGGDTENCKKVNFLLLSLLLENFVKKNFTRIGPCERARTQLSEYVWHLGVLMIKAIVIQRPKNAGGRVALPPGRFGSIRKILGHGLLKTSQKNTSEQPKLCPDSSKYVRTVQDVSVQFKIYPYSSKYVWRTYVFCRSREIIMHFFGTMRKIFMCFSSGRFFGASWKILGF